MEGLYELRMRTKWPGAGALSDRPFTLHTKSVFIWAKGQNDAFWVLFSNYPAISESFYPFYDLSLLEILFVTRRPNVAQAYIVWNKEEIPPDDRVLAQESTPRTDPPLVFHDVCLDPTVESFYPDEEFQADNVITRYNMGEDIPD